MTLNVLICSNPALRYYVITVLARRSLDDLEFLGLFWSGKDMSYCCI